MRAVAPAADTRVPRRDARQLATRGGHISGSNPIDRRQFLGKSALVAAVAAAVTGARQASAQINNAAGAAVKPVRLGFIGAGIRGTLLMEAAAGTRPTPGRRRRRRDSVN
jgi:hypothetical protein